MKRLIAFIFLLSVTCLTYAVDKKEDSTDKYQVQPLVVSSYANKVLDLWATSSYFFTPFSNLGLYGGLQPYYLQNQFTNVGVEAELYSARVNLIKYGLELGYSGGGYFERENKDIRLNSHWMYIDMHLRLQYLCVGFLCKTLLANSTKNAYETSIFRFNDSYYPVMPIGYLGVLGEFSKLKLEARMGFGLSHFNPQKMFLADADTLHDTMGVHVAFKISYKFFSTSRTNRPAGWW